LGARVLRRGNSAFAFIGSYTDKSDGTHVKVSTQRYNPDPAFRPLFGTDMITLTLNGTEQGDMVDFEGTAQQLPGVTFKAVLIRVSDWGAATTAAWAASRQNRCSRSGARLLP
jgi:hypothetical protein